VKGNWKQLGDSHWVEVPDQIQIAPDHWIPNPEKVKKKKTKITKRTKNNLSIIDEVEKKN
jgi:hypothetical protein